MGSILTSLIVGMGEVGRAHFDVIRRAGAKVWGMDVKPELRQMAGCPKHVDCLHICLRYSSEFESIMAAYVKQYSPRYINVCTTVPCGTTEKLFGPGACHSTTRGLHPHLSEGLKTITKHIGGGESLAIGQFFENVLVPNETHPKSRTTELLHILNNAHYGVNLMFADEAAALCREYGVDVYDYLKYTETNNAGYMALGQQTKVRPILTPPNGRIGGHCVMMSAGLIPKDKRTPLISKLAEFGK